VDLWSIARYDLGLSLSEFAELTPSMFAALCKRRNIRLKHERFANALTAAAVYNVNRSKAEDPMTTAFDFVRDEKANKALSETRLLKKQIKDAVGHMPSSTPRNRFLKMRVAYVAELKKLGRTDAEELWAECWPSLVPTKEDEWTHD
jgi:hypothetical protein